MASCWQMSVTDVSNSEVGWGQETPGLGADDDGWKVSEKSKHTSTGSWSE